MKRLTILLLALLPVCVAAQDAAGVPGLPPQDVVLRAIEQTPEVRLAEARLARADAEAAIRRAGPHEATLTLIPQHRNVGGSTTYREWEADLTRPVRWPFKARLDREIGALGQETAHLQLEDAHHAAARRLLALWSAWSRAVGVREQTDAMVAIWQRDRAQIARRVALGEAAQRDLLAADAALAQAQAAAVQADSDAQAAQLELAAAFPALPLPGRPRLAEAPLALAGADADWVALIVRRSHEIGAADAHARQKDTEARRARADRLPDLTVGLRMLDEQGGRERALGVVVGVPLGTRHRAAQAAAAGADATGAAAELALVRRDVELNARQAVTAARGRHAVWQRQRAALDAARASAAKAERAYALGEAGLAEVLAARRVEQEAALAERRAAVDAQEAVARVEVDAHEMWHRHVGTDAEDTPAQGAPHVLRLPDLGG